MMALKVIKQCFSYTLRHNEKVAFFGSWPVGYPTLKVLHQRFGQQNIEVITHSISSSQNTNDSQSHNNQVIQYCQKHNITYHTPIHKKQLQKQKLENWEKLQTAIRSKVINEKQINFKIGVICSYGYMIPERILNIFQDSLILAHPSLIPKYRGGAPIYHAIANGDKKTGVSYLQVRPNEFDTGNLLHQVEYEVDQQKNYRQIEQQLADLCAKEVLYVLDNLSRLRPGISQQKLLQQATNLKQQYLTARIVHDKSISPNLPAQKLYNLDRAMMRPRIKFMDKPLIIHFNPIYVQDEENKYQPGQLVLMGKKLYMKSSDKLIQLRSWQEITKKELPMYMFINQFIQNRKSYNHDLYFH